MQTSSCNENESALVPLLSERRSSLQPAGSPVKSRLGLLAVHAAWRSTCRLAEIFCFGQQLLRCLKVGAGCSPARQQGLQLPGKLLPSHADAQLRARNGITFMLAARGCPSTAAAAAGAAAVAAAGRRPLLPCSAGLGAARQTAACAWICCLAHQRLLGSCSAWVGREVRRWLSG